MSVDTKAILINEPEPAELAVFLEGRFGLAVAVERSSDEHVVLAFADPVVAGHRRRLHWFGREVCFHDHAAIWDKPACSLNLGAWGGSVEIMESLAGEFGGFVQSSDGNAWRRITGRCEATTGFGVEDLLTAARRHGEDNEPGHEIGDIQDALRVAFGLLGPEKQAALLRHPTVLANLELGGVDLTQADASAPGPRQ